MTLFSFTRRSSQSETAPAGESLPSRTDRRALAISLLIVVVYTAFCFQKLVRHPTDLLVGPQRAGNNDLTAAFLAFRDLPRQIWERFGELPLWNPYSLGGTPYLGNPQAAMFYPPNWLTFPFAAASTISWLFVLHHVLAGAGMVLWTRRLGLSWIGATSSALVFLASPYLTAHTCEGHYNQITTVAWYPWALLAFERLRARARFGVMGVAGVLAIAFFCGHPQEIYYLYLMMGAFVLVEIAGLLWKKEWQPALGWFGRWVVVTLVFGGLIAVEFMPNWIYSKQTVRGGGMSADVAGIGIQPQNLRELLNHRALGGPEVFGYARMYWETVCHFGILTLALAVAGSFLAWHRYPTRRIVVVAIVAFNFAFGFGNPVFMAMHATVPGIGFFRAPSRILFLCALCVAVLAGLALDELQRRATERRLLHPIARRTVAGALGAVLAMLICSLLGWTSSAIQTVAPASAWVWMAIGLSILLIGHGWHKFQRAACIGLALFAAIELAVKADDLFRTVPIATLRQGGRVGEFLAARPSDSRVLAGQFFYSDREAWSQGVSKLQAYEPVPLRRMIAVMESLSKKGTDAVPLAMGFEPFRIEDFHKSVADLLAVRYVITLPPAKAKTTDSDDKMPQVPDDWKLLATGSTAPTVVLRGQRGRTIPCSIYENPDALPRAYVVGQVRQSAEGDAMIPQLRDLDPRREVLLRDDVLPPGQRAEFTAANITHSSANRVVVTTELQAPGYLCLSDTWFQGWRASDNGRPVTILPANIHFRAVPLAAGKHEVIFEYRPRAFFLGAAVTVMTFLGCLLASLKRKPQLASS